MSARKGEPAAGCRKRGSQRSLPPFLLSGPIGVRIPCRWHHPELRKSAKLKGRAPGFESLLRPARVRLSRASQAPLAFPGLCCLGGKGASQLLSRATWTPWGAPGWGGLQPGAAAVWCGGWAQAQGWAGWAVFSFGTLFTTLSWFMVQAKDPHTRNKSLHLSN